MSSSVETFNFDIDAAVSWSENENSTTLSHVRFRLYHQLSGKSIYFGVRITIKSQPDASADAALKSRAAWVVFVPEQIKEIENEPTALCVVFHLRHVPLLIIPKDDTDINTFCDNWDEACSLARSTTFRVTLASYQENGLSPSKIRDVLSAHGRSTTNKGPKLQSFYGGKGGIVFTPPSPDETLSALPDETSSLSTDELSPDEFTANPYTKRQRSDSDTMALDTTKRPRTMEDDHSDGEVEDEDLDGQVEDEDLDGQVQERQDDGRMSLTDRDWERLERLIGRKMECIARRMDKVEDRMDRMEERMEERMERLEERMGDQLRHQKRCFLTKLEKLQDVFESDLKNFRVELEADNNAMMDGVEDTVADGVWEKFQDRIKSCFDY